MARCPFESLVDLSDVLAKIRKLPGIREDKPGIFYLGNQGFLHFHIKDGRRWADVRDGKKWGIEIDVQAPAKASDKAAFLKEVLDRHSRSQPSQRTSKKT